MGEKKIRTDVGARQDNLWPRDNTVAAATILSGGALSDGNQRGLCIFSLDVRSRLGGCAFRNMTWAVREDRDGNMVLYTLHWGRRGEGGGGGEKRKV